MIKAILEIGEKVLNLHEEICKGINEGRGVHDEMITFECLNDVWGILLKAAKEEKKYDE